MFSLLKQQQQQLVGDIIKSPLVSSRPAPGGEAAGRLPGVSRLPGRSRQERAAEFHLQAGERVRATDLVSGASPAVSSSFQEKCPTFTSRPGFQFFF